MSILQILQYPDLRLRRKGHQVTDVKSPKIQKIIDNMLETLLNTENCAALASTQLDLENPPNITVINMPINDSDKNELICLVNPQITKKEGSTIDKEGCMSVYPQELYADVTRATKIQVKAIDQHGNKLEFEATDYFARCIQHEYDHLKGVLYIDHLTKSYRSRILKPYLP